MATIFSGPGPQASPLVKQYREESEVPTRLFQIALIAILTLIPPLRLAYFLFTNGENCANNDDINFLEQLERMSTPGYNWLNFFSDTFINGHCAAINQLVFCAYSHLAHLNQYTGSAIGLALIAIRLVLFFDLFCRRSDNRKWICLALLSAIIFGPTDASILTQGTFAITWQIALTASACALWAVFRLTGFTAIATASACIVVGSWTIATTLAIIPIIWWFAWRLKLLNSSTMPCLSTASLVALLPYAILLPTGTHTSLTIFHLIRPCDFQIFISSLGRNFAPGTAWYFGELAPSEIFAIFGLALFFAVLTLTSVIRREGTDSGEQNPFSHEFKSALASCLFATTNLFLITIVRPGITPWYGQISIWFWLGLVGMVNSLLTYKVSNEKLKFGTKLFAGTALTTILSFTLFSPTFEDKEFYLQNRSAVYLSILRNYNSPPPQGLVPPYADIRLQPARLARLLEQYHLPPFGKQDTILFQGDCVVPGLVQFRNDGTEDSKLCFMSNDKKGIFTATYYKRLNLCISGSMTVTWHVKVPDDAKVAEFTTGLWQLEPTINKIPDVKPNVLSIEVGSNQTLVYEMRPDEETKVKLDLLAYKGKVVDIAFTHKQNNPRPTVLEVPKVEIERE